MKKEDWLIVGLGNPDSRYEKNRHNVGFLLIDYAIKNREVKEIKNKYSYLCESLFQGEKIFFAKPYFFVNESGIPIKKLISDLEIKISNLIVVVDDMNLDLGNIRIRKKGQDGGHNGLKSIEYHLGTCEYPRLKIGVGSPSNKKDHIKYILSDFKKNEDVLISKVFEKANESINEILVNGFHSAMGEFN